jgi:DNA-binding CsgD family transcriptional regulator
MNAGGTEKLSEGQRQCLRMVLRHMSSKEIARALGISRHTVDQRLRMAMTLLGASSRVEASRLFAEAEGLGPAGYQRFAYQSPELASAPEPPPLPSRRSREEKTDGRLRKVAWIVGIAAGAAILFAALFTGLNALSQFTR